MMFVVVVNCVYYGLKSCIFVEVDNLRITGRMIYSPSLHLLSR